MKRPNWTTGYLPTFKYTINWQNLQISIPATSRQRITEVDFSMGKVTKRRCAFITNPTVTLQTRARHLSHQTDLTCGIPIPPALGQAFTRPLRYVDFFFFERIISKNRGLFIFDARTHTAPSRRHHLSPTLNQDLTGHPCQI